MKSKKRNTRRTIMDLFMMLVLLVGVGALLYPFVSDSLNTLLDQQLIAHYQHQANSEDEAAMKKKNAELAKTGGAPGADPWSEAVKKQKLPKEPTEDYFEAHTIGVIDIPKISVKLPIFDETNDLFLSKGTSLLSGTSYPNGGKSTHAVISGHRGLPEAKLFTDLPKLKKGNHFYIHINKQIHAYEVDQINVVEPTDTEALHIQKNQDLVTLLTCTPYMVNSHRLLVRGHRVPYVPEKNGKDLKQGSYERWIRVIGILLGSLLLLVLLLVGFFRWLKGIRIANRRYLLKLVLLDQKGQPIVNQRVTLYSRNGRREMTREGSPLAAKTDESGTVELHEVKGGRYRLKTEEGPWIKAKIKKVSDDAFQLATTKKSVFRLVDKEKNLFMKKEDQRR